MFRRHMSILKHKIWRHNLSLDIRPFSSPLCLRASGGFLRLKPAASHRLGAADVPLLGSPGFVPDVGKTKAPRPAGTGRGRKHDVGKNRVTYGSAYNAPCPSGWCWLTGPTPFLAFRREYASLAVWRLQVSLPLSRKA